MKVYDKEGQKGKQAHREEREKKVIQWLLAVLFIFASCA